MQRFLFEVPTQTIKFNRFDLAADEFIVPALYGTGGVGEEIQLTQGEITYLGRLEIEDIQFEENADKSSGKPIAIKLVFSDALEDDLLTWKQEYKLFQDRLPNQRIVGIWGGREYIPVSIVKRKWPRLGGFDFTGISLPNIVLPSLSF